MGTSPYIVREVDGADEDIGETLHKLHWLTFLNSAPSIDPTQGQWWLAYFYHEPVGFINICRSPVYVRPPYGYFNRVGVLRRHRGNRLQVRLMRAMEACARRNGWHGIVSDTTKNPASANSFIRGGYYIFEPKKPWSFNTAVYWRKDF